MNHIFTCRYCGKTKPWDDRDYDMGLYLAEMASLEALGYSEYVIPYLICKQCAEEIRQSN